MALIYNGCERRPLVHWLLHSQATLWMVQTRDLPQEVNRSLEVWPFTMEEAWAQRLLVCLPGLDRQAFPPLDRRPIGPASHERVHLVILGFDPQAEAVATMAALTAHYPNYRGSDERPLRTRITIIDNHLESRRDAFIARRQQLFDHSWWREVDVARRETRLHRPMHCGRRMDFVDVEWEFVEGSAQHPVVRQHLEEWVSAPGRQTTLVVSHADQEQNLSEALSLPRAVGERKVPVLVRLSDSHLANLLRHAGQRFHPFGMEGEGYDVELPLLRLAKMLKYFYDCSYGQKGVPTELPWEEVEAGWRSEKSFRMRFSNVANVMTMATKMRSLGHDTADGDTFYALTQREIELLSPCEHNRWSVERLLMGTRPCTDEEREAVRRDKSLKTTYKKERNAHFDLCAYEELEADETGRNARLYDYDLTACIPLMIKTFNAL